MLIFGLFSLSIIKLWVITDSVGIFLLGLVCLLVGLLVVVVVIAVGVITSHVMMAEGLVVGVLY